MLAAQNARRFAATARPVWDEMRPLRTYLYARPAALTNFSTALLILLALAFMDAMLGTWESVIRTAVRDRCGGSLVTNDVEAAGPRRNQKRRHSVEAGT
jgi:hypothetical protein